MKTSSKVIDNEITAKMIEENERKERYKLREDISEFYSFIVDFNVLDITYADDSPQIPIRFKNGKDYIAAFMPAFFDELKGVISSALNQIDLTENSILELRLFNSTSGIGLLTPGQEMPKSKRSFYNSIKSDDLILLLPYNPKLDLSSLASLKRQETTCFVGICERENKRKP